jgi:hypothetical protein
MKTTQTPQPIERREYPQGTEVLASHMLSGELGTWRVVESNKVFTTLAQKVGENIAEQVISNESTSKPVRPWQYLLIPPTPRFQKRFLHYQQILEAAA